VQWERSLAEQERHGRQSAELEPGDRSQKWFQRTIEP
jgi:hypothetical protein